MHEAHFHIKHYGRPSTSHILKLSIAERLWHNENVNSEGRGKFYETTVSV